jgi:hypothetical protein
MKEWPSPVVRLFLGQTTPSAVLAAAEDLDPEVRKVRMCDANFFGGELAVLQGRRVEAERQLRLVLIDCLPGSPERDVAKTELRRFGLLP